MPIKYHQRSLCGERGKDTKRAKERERLWRRKSSNTGTIKISQDYKFIDQVKAATTNSTLLLSPQQEIAISGQRAKELEERHVLWNRVCLSRTYLLIYLHKYIPSFNPRGREFNFFLLASKHNYLFPKIKFQGYHRIEILITKNERLHFRSSLFCKINFNLLIHIDHHHWIPLSLRPSTGRLQIY